MSTKRGERLKELFGVARHQGAVEAQKRILWWILTAIGASAMAKFGVWLWS